MYIKRYLLDDIMSSFPFAVEFKGNFLHTGTRLGARKRCISLEVRYKLVKSWN